MSPAGRRLVTSVMVCAHNEEAYIAGSLCWRRPDDSEARAPQPSSRHPPDEIVAVDNASTDRTGDVARRVPGIRVIDEPRKGLVMARARGRSEGR